MSMEEQYYEDYTQDGTVDLKGNPVRRSKTGGWRACSFIVVYEIFERMAYYGISSNLITYLITKLHQDIVTSSNNVTNWYGTTWIMPIVGAYIADAHFGRYYTFVFSAAIYLTGMILLTLAVSLPSLRPPVCNDPALANCKKATTFQLAFFYGALYVLAIGTGGTKPNISTIGADQFDDFDPKEKTRKLSFFNWWFFSIFMGTLFANTVIVYLQDNVGWTLGFGLPTLGLAVAIAVFLIGTSVYRHKAPVGTPFTRMAKVIVASVRKGNVEVPIDAKQLHEVDSEEYSSKKGKFRIDSTPTLKFLNKACVKTGDASPWMLCSVTQVEETKQMLRMVPILLATLVPSTMLTQVGTLFVKQGTTLDRRIGNLFEVPPASLTGFVTVSMLVCVVLYDRYIVRGMKKLTGNPRGITLLQRMGVGLVIHIVIMLIASLTERYRLQVAKDHGLVQNGGHVPRTIFILLPQYVLMGIADAFLEVAKIEFFYDQAPENMKSLGTSYSMTSLGLGSFLSTFLLSMVARFTERNGRSGGWILNNLNASHLDYYYAFFTILNLLNFVFFLLVAKFYVYKAELSDHDSNKILQEDEF